MKDPRGIVIASLNPDSIAIRNPKRFIFFCGGILSNKAGEPVSLRGLVIRWLKTKNHPIHQNICLAEDVSTQFKNDLFSHDAQYPDLITLETDLANLADLIVLIVESPGSIAELGAFSVVSGIREKLQVFIRSERLKSESFIKLGPIQSLQNDFSNAVKSYPWATLAAEDDRIDPSGCADVIEDICEDIIQAASKTSQEVHFRATETRHKMLLIVGIIELFGCLLHHEIEQYLDDLNAHVESEELRRYLYLLSLLGFIEKVPYGSNYYFPANESMSRILSFSLKDSKKDSLSIKIETIQYYRQFDEKRFRIIKRVSARRAQA